MPADGLARLRTSDAIYFGAVGDPNVPDHITLWGLRLPICQGFDQYANVRPTRILPGITSPLRDCRPRRSRLGDRARELRGRILPATADACIAACPKRSAPRSRSSPASASSASCASPSTLAQSRPRKLLTVVTKSNAQRHGMVMWDEIAGRGRDGFPGRHLGQGCWSMR